MNWWPWLLFCAEIIGLSIMTLTARSGLWWGWLIVIATMSGPWLIYSLTTRQWGFLALTALWASSYTLNALNWRKKTANNQTIWRK